MMALPSVPKAAANADAAPKVAAQQKRRGGWFTKAQTLCEAILNEQHERARELAQDWYAGPENL